jgi:hypothetical protein
MRNTVVVVVVVAAAAAAAAVHLFAVLTMVTKLRFPNFLIRFASPTYKIRPSTTLLDRKMVPRYDTSRFRCGVLGTFASLMLCSVCW